jgi:hypothetical protein
MEVGTITHIGYVYQNLPLLPKLIFFIFLSSFKQESEADSERRKLFGGRWDTPASAALTGDFSEKGDAQGAFLATAQTDDTRVQAGAIMQFVFSFFFPFLATAQADDTRV